MGVFLNPGSDAPTENPAYEEGVGWTPSWLEGKPVRQGMLLGQNGGGTLNFLFNPSTIDVNYEYNENLLAGTGATVTPVQGDAANFAVGATCSFQLLFDRTRDYNRIRGSGETQAPGGNQGVLLDIMVFENLVGVSEGGLMISKPIRAMFGAAARGDSTPENPGGRGFYFDGVCIAAAVTFTFFAHDMMPTRCVLAITLRKRAVRDDFAQSGSQAGLGAIGGLFGSGGTAAGSPLPGNPSQGFPFI